MKKTKKAAHCGWWSRSGCDAMTMTMTMRMRMMMMTMMEQQQPQQHHHNDHDTTPPHHHTHRSIECKDTAQSKTRRCKDDGTATSVGRRRAIRGMTTTTKAAAAAAHCARGRRPTCSSSLLSHLRVDARVVDRAEHDVDPALGRSSDGYYCFHPIERDAS